MSQLAILAIAVLGKEGNPLAARSFSQRRGGQADLKWHYAAHTALDYFDERGQSIDLAVVALSLTSLVSPSPPPRAELPAAKTTEAYLGLLYAMEDYAVYGYQTNTRIKFVVVLGLADAVIRDVDVKIIFRAIHNAYIAYISNPFTTLLDSQKPASLAAPIRSAKFLEAIDDIAGKPAHTDSDLL
ncbi:hypothetical protein JCM10212_000455 [Sporobolomyces blumeae]